MTIRSFNIGDRFYSVADLGDGRYRVIAQTRGENEPHVFAADEHFLALLGAMAEATDAINGLPRTPFG